MFDRILVPLDGSSTAEVVLPHVRRLLRGKTVEAILSKVEDLSLLEGQLPVDDESIHCAREYLRLAVSRLAETGVRARPLVRIGPVVRTLLETVERERADLVALASHGATGSEAALLGSVAEGLFRSSPVPVYVVRAALPHAPADQELGEFKEMLVSTDGSELSLSIVPHTIAFAKAYRMKVQLLYVLPARSRSQPVRHTESTLKLSEESLVREWMKRIAELFEREGLSVRVFVERGDSAEGIDQTAAAQGADLIAMSTRGLTGAKQAIVGSVTAAVLRRTRLPLLVIGTAAPIPKETAGLTLQAFRGGSSLSLDEEVPRGRTFEDPGSSRPRPLP